jgi:F-type H+-transporting ATPase subunit epsilon
VYEKTFSVEIVTPARVIFQGEITSLSAPGTVGGFQVLYNHAPLLSSLGTGVLKIREPEGKDVVYATSGGFVEVKNNKAVVLVESAEPPAEIDVARAEAAMERAKKRLAAPSPDIDVDRARAALARALNRLHVAGKS